jgi:hypothetical protein
MCFGFDGIRAWSVTRRHEEAAEIETVEKFVRCGGRSHRDIRRFSSYDREASASGTPGTSLVDLVNATMKGETEVEGIACSQVTASHPKRTDLELPENEIWIEKQTLHLRRITHGTVHLPSEELRGGIVLDEPLPDQLFVCPTR